MIDLLLLIDCSLMIAYILDSPNNPDITTHISQVRKLKGSERPPLVQGHLGGRAGTGTQQCGFHTTSSFHGPRTAWKVKFIPLSSGQFGRAETMWADHSLTIYPQYMYVAYSFGDGLRFLGIFLFETQDLIFSIQLQTHMISPILF